MPSLTISAQLESLTRLVDFLGKFSAHENLSREVTDRLQLVVEELFVNVVHHSQKANWVQLEVSRSETEVQIVMMEDGEPFDWTNSRNTTMETSLCEISIGGRGLNLVRHYSTQLDYGHSEQGNRIQLRIPINEG
ncbi:MAG: ATP-binding protein [Planctomycetaceae bacterium]|nr:ATP-binding protein [Planctomycetaceae bacterium]